MPISQKGRQRSSKGGAAAQYHMSAAADTWRVGFLNAKSGSFLGLLVPLESRAGFDVNGFAEGLIHLKLLYYLDK